MTRLKESTLLLSAAGGALPASQLRQRRMPHYLRKTLRTSFEDALARVTKALQGGGFGVLTEVDVQTTLEKELPVKFRPYRILGACHPLLASRTLQVEGHLGTMLPFNITVRETGEEQIQISTIDPTTLTQVTGSSALATIARQLRKELWAAMRTL